MNDLFVIVAILLGNSILNILTWGYILGRGGKEIRKSVEELKDTIRVIKGE